MNLFESPKLSEAFMKMLELALRRGYKEWVSFIANFLDYVTYEDLRDVTDEDDLLHNLKILFEASFLNPKDDKELLYNWLDTDFTSKKVIFYKEAPKELVEIFEVSGFDVEIQDKEFLD